MTQIIRTGSRAVSGDVKVNEDTLVVLYRTMHSSAPFLLCLPFTTPVAFPTSNTTNPPLSVLHHLAVSVHGAPRCSLSIQAVVRNKTHPFWRCILRLRLVKREKRTVDLGFSMCPSATNSLTAKDDWSEFCAAIYGTGNTSSVAQNEIKRGGRLLNYFILLNIFASLVTDGDLHHYCLMT